MNADNILEMRHITKAFFGIKALDDVSVSVKRGEIHAIVGENGAGKSTLMKVLSGVHKADEGEIAIEGEKVSITNPADARALGIAIVYQEVSLVDEMTIADNMFLGVEPRKLKVFLDEAQIVQKAQEILDDFGLELAATQKVGSLSIAQQQMVEFAKAIFFDARIFVLDEPTASLSDSEVAALFRQIRQLKEKGVTFIYISHRLDEVFSLCDSVTVLRDSKLIDSKPISDMTKDEMIKKMVGRDITDLFDSNRVIPDSDVTMLEVKNFTNRYLKDVSFTLRKGEILGVAGLVGSRRTELMRALYGVDRLEKGEVVFDGERVNIKSPVDAVKLGIVLVPEDRKNSGLILMQTVAFNTTLAVVKSFIKGIRVNRKKEREIVDEYAHKLSIKMSGTDQTCQYLSGGNQQKVVVSKWLAANAKIIIFDEPTRGIDIAAKAEIYELIHRLVGEGYSIIMVSSEMEEIVNMSTRIVVMCDGRLTGTIDVANEYPDGYDGLQERILEYSLGGKEK